MIDLTALKEQLRLLGHQLPDEQIKAILADMNIDVDDKDAVVDGGDGGDAERAAGVPTTAQPTRHASAPGMASAGAPRLLSL